MDSEKVARLGRLGRDAMRARIALADASADLACAKFALANLTEETDDIGFFFEEEVFICESLLLAAEDAQRLASSEFRAAWDARYAS